ncbi:MAG: response regulator [Chloroflexi bacterium]|jgi:class 3 adenylate cyclase|nr:response regulator [Chloroflexota bacterium]
MDLTSVFNRAPRILVVDDDWLNRDLLRAYLTSSGSEVVTAADGQAAFDLALGRGGPLDLALVDIQMPRMNGLELCRQLKAAPETRFVPVIIVTALDSEDEKLKAIEAGADDFVTKPYNSTVLLTRVRSLLRLKKLHDDLESRNQLLRQVLDGYVSEDVVDVLLTDPERYLKLGGEARKVSVLFADIRGFTRFTEEHSAPEVVETLNRVFRALSHVVFAHRGTFDKYLGDGLMAFYGAPIAGNDDARRAVETAIEMQLQFHQVAEEFGVAMQGLGLGIGIHSGEAIVGNIGSDRVMDYTVVGDTVNIAKRLQEVALAGQTLVSQATLLEVPGVAARRLEPLELPGRQEPVLAYVIEG